MSNAQSATGSFRVRLNSNAGSRVVRFVVAGAGATLLNLLLLWVLSGRLGMPYLPASVMSFSIALTCNFVVQKIWAFDSPQIARVNAQGVQFLAANLFNLALNTGILYILVDRLAISYLVAQILSSALVSLNSYCAYRWIFQERRSATLHRSSDGHWWSAGNRH